MRVIKVRLEGFEPPRPFGHDHLKIASLPVSPQPRECSKSSEEYLSLETDPCCMRATLRRRFIRTRWMPRQLVRRYSTPTLLAGAYEQRHDVPGHVREVVAQVPVWASAIDEVAPVRSNAPANERPRTAFDQLSLPWLKRDYALVLEPPSVLWKQTRQVTGVQTDERDRPAVGNDLADRVLGEAALKERSAGRDDSGVLRVQCDPKPIGAGVGRDASVAEVHREQLRVVPPRGTTSAWMGANTSDSVPFQRDDGRSVAAIRVPSSAQY
jgi:hypothetical protein